MSASPNHPWNRQANETSEAFDLFDSYLRMRSVTDVARLHYGRDGAATEGEVVAGRTYCQRLKKEYNWDQRVAAYDRWVGKQRDQVTATLIKKQASLMARGQVAIVKDLQRKYRRVSKLLDKQLDAEEAKDEDSKDLNPHIGALNMLASAGKIIVGEIDKIVKANPLEEVVDSTQSQEVQSAREKLMTIIDKRDPDKKDKKGEEGVA